MKTKIFFKKAVVAARTLSIFIIIAIGLPVVYLKYIVRDIQPIDDSDMKFEIKKIPGSENAYPLLRLAELPYKDHPLTDPILMKINSLSKKLQNNMPVSDLELDETAWLFQERITTIERASTMKYAQGPFSVKADDHLPNRISLRDLARLNLGLAKRDFANGKKDEAFESALKMARFGHLVEENDGGSSIISLMVGSAIKQNSLFVINDFLDTGYLPDDPKKTVKELSTLYESDTAWSNAFKAEYKSMKYIVEMYASSDTFKSEVTDEAFRGFAVFPDSRAAEFVFKLIFKPQRTIKASRDFALARIQDSSQASVSEFSPFDWNEHAPAEYFSRKFFKLLAKGELGMNYFEAVLIPNFPKAVEMKYYVDFLTDATRLKLAVLDYNKERGELPGSLEILAPEYIDSIPFDRFSGKALLYDARRGIIYSTGMNFADDGGSYKNSVADKAAWNNIRDEKDIVLKLIN